MQRKRETECDCERFSELFYLRMDVWTLILGTRLSGHTSQSNTIAGILDERVVATTIDGGPTCGTRGREGWDKGEVRWKLTYDHDPNALFDHPCATRDRI